MPCRPMVAIGCRSGLQTLATIYNVTGNADALTYYNLVKGKKAPGTSVADYQKGYAKFNVVPAGGVIEPRPRKSPLPLLHPHHRLAGP